MSHDGGRHSSIHQPGRATALDNLPGACWISSVFPRQFDRDVFAVASSVFDFAFSRPQVKALGS